MTLKEAYESGASLGVYVFDNPSIVERVLAMRFAGDDVAIARPQVREFLAPKPFAYFEGPVIKRGDKWVVGIGTFIIRDDLDGEAADDAERKTLEKLIGNEYGL